jgi:phage recombination protein Bet
MSNALTVLADKLAERFGIPQDGEVLTVLKQTAFKVEVTDAQMTALLIVAQQYGLNPWTKEIHAFPDKRGGIVPVVGLDGWSRIINEHPAFDGMDFEVSKDEATCTIYRKDRAHPIRLTEYMEECRRDTDPWKGMPRRMLRHKAMIQCARLAFGFAGIYDPDEAERIVGSIDASTGEITTGRKPAVAMPQARTAPRLEPDADGVLDVEVKPVRPQDDTLASVGEIAYIRKKIEAKGLTIADARDGAGLDPYDSLDGLTCDGFLALKDSLL